MPTVTWGIGWMWMTLVVVGAMLAELTVGITRAEEAPSAPPPVRGCSWAPPRGGAEAPAAVAEADDGNEEEDEEEEDEPKIVGSLAAPPNTRRNDQRALGAVATVTRDQAIKIALGALPDADARRVEDVELEIEQGFVIWEVEAIRRGREPHPDKYAEVVIDAGNGAILFVECEAEDD